VSSNLTFHLQYTVPVDEGSQSDNNPGLSHSIAPDVNSNCIPFPLSSNSTSFMQDRLPQNPSTSGAASFSLGLDISSRHLASRRVSSVSEERFVQFHHYDTPNDCTVGNPARMANDMSSMDSQNTTTALTGRSPDTASSFPFNSGLGSTETPSATTNAFRDSASPRKKYRCVYSGCNSTYTTKVNLQSIHPSVHIGVR
jgi:hypothetical protein